MSQVNSTIFGIPRLLRLRNESPTEGSGNILQMFEKSKDRVRQSASPDLNCSPATSPPYQHNKKRNNASRTFQQSMIAILIIYQKPDQIFTELIKFVIYVSVSQEWRVRIPSEASDGKINSSTFNLWGKLCVKYDLFADSSWEDGGIILSDLLGYLI